MNDVLAGMTSAEAKALVALASHGNSSLWTGEAGPGGQDIECDAIERLLALAALGAEVVGAKDRREERFWCHECGNGVSIGEDGGCGSCGRDTEIRVCRVLVLEGE